MIPLGLATNAGAAADIFDVVLALVVFGTIGVAVVINLGAAFSWLRICTALPVFDPFRRPQNRRSAHFIDVDVALKCCILEPCRSLENSRPIPRSASLT
jgi:hypothetical protein